MPSVAHNIGFATLGRIIVNLIGIVIVGLMTRALGPERFGQYNAVFAYLFLFNVLADMGLYTLLVREISREGADESSITSKLFTFRLILIIASSVLAIAVALILPYTSLVRTGIAIASLSIICSSLVQVLMGVFQKHLALHWAAITDIATRLVQLLGIFLLISWGRAGIIPFIWVVVVAGFVQLFLSILFARRLIPFRLRIDIPYWRSMLGESLPIAVSLIFVLLYFKIDTVMLSLMKPAYDVGVYSVGYKVLEVVIFFPAMYIGLIMPLLSKFANDSEKFKTIFRRAFLVLAATAIPTVVGLIIFSKPIVGILGGADFVRDAAPALVILSFAVGIIFFGNLGGNAIIALGIQRRGMWIYGAGAVFNIIANLIFIPRYSYLAAAWATVATELLVTVGMFLLILKATRDTAARL